MRPVGARASGLPALVAATAAWGSSIALIEIAARGVPVTTITLIEMVAALAFLGGLIAVTRTRLMLPSRRLVLAGALEPGFAYPLLNAGLARTSGSHGSVIIGLEAVLVVLLAACFARSWPARRVLAATALTFVGVLVLVGSGAGHATLLGDSLTFAGVLAASVYVLVAKGEAQTADPLALTFFQFVSGGMVIIVLGFTPLGHGLDAPTSHATDGEVLAAVGAGVAGSALAFLLYNWALDRVSAALAGLSLALIPVFGLAFSALWLEEAVTGRTAVAAAMVVSGLLLAVDRHSPGDSMIAASPAEPARDVST